MNSRAVMLLTEPVSVRSPCFQYSVIMIKLTCECIEGVVCRRLQSVVHS